MDEPQVKEAVATLPPNPRPIPVAPQSCPTCGASSAPNNNSATPAPSYVYALGRIVARHPTPSVEKELMQVAGREDTKGLTDPQVHHKILSDRHNRYLVRKLCWVLTIENQDTYILLPRDPSDYDLLVESLRASPQLGDHDLVIGVKGPIAPPEMCNGLMVPVVFFDQIYSFDRDTLIKSIPKPEKISAKEFAPAAEELFDRIMRMADNAGAADEHRALNYLAVRYHRTYEAVAEAHAQNESLSAVDVQSSALSGTRKVVEVVFSFTHRSTGVVSKHSVRVDVTDQFPFLVTKLSPYYDR